MKELFKDVLKRMKLLSGARAMLYWLTQFDPKATHPRRTTVRFYSQFIKKGDLCFDLGANVGARTGIFLELGARVVSVEPHPACLKELHRSFGRNRSVSIVPKGVADKEGFLELSICEEAPVFSTMSDRFKNESAFFKQQGYKWTKLEKVPVTTLDMLITQYGVPAFCKIDIEDFEKEALRGLTKPVPALSFEFRTEFIDNPKTCIERLLEIGNYRFNLAIGERRELFLPEWADSRTINRHLDALKAENPEIWGDIYARLSQGPK